MVDCETRRVVDLLPGRDADPLTAWLQQHRAPRVICRDRASAYAEAARTGAPKAVQVADRFHLRAQPGRRSGTLRGPAQGLL